MVSMGWKAGLGAIALASMAAASVAAASPRCATPDEMMAIQIEEIHEQLVVANDNCNQAEQFDAYQQRYAKERLRANVYLLGLFRRLHGGHLEDYDSFRTHVANAASKRSDEDRAAFCHETGRIFEAALIANKPSLTSFASGIDIATEGPVAACSLQVDDADIAPSVAPMPNPLRQTALAVPSAPPAQQAQQAASHAGATISN